MLTGYLATLPQDCLLSAGVLYYTKGGSYVPIGVTEGAPDFDAASEQVDIMFDNRAAARVKGLTRVVGYQPIVKGTMKEFGSAATGNQIAVFEPGETEATSSGVTTVTPRATGSLFAAGDYLVDFRWVFERSGGGYACIYAPIAICRKWSKKGNDKKEAQIAFEIEFVGDPVNDFSTAPYTVELRTTLPTSAPTTPTALLTAYNALGGGGTGATMRNVYQRGVNMTIGAGKCTRWGDAVTNLNPWTPSADVGGGAGATVGGESGTSIIAAGLELTASVMDPIIALVQRDTSSEANNPTSGAPPGGQVIYDIFRDHTKGLFIGGAVRMLTNTKPLSLESGGADDLYFNPDHFNAWAPLVDSLANVGNPNTFDGGSSRFRIGWWLVDTPNTGGRGVNWTFQQFGRDLLKKGKTLTTDPVITGVTGRRLRLGVDGGFPIAHGAEYNLVYLSTGRENKAQNKLVNEYLKLIFPDMWADPRTRLGINLGNSWQDGIDYPFPGGFASDDIGLPHDVLLGHTARHLARLPDCAFYSLAYAGDTVAELQYAMTQLLGDMDFTTRSRVAIGAAEYLNGGNPAQNYFMLDKLRTIDPKVHTTTFDLTYSTNANLATNFPAYNDSLDANALTHSDALIWMIRGPNSGINVPWRSRNFGDGTTSAYPVGENPLLWAVQHPGVLFNQLLSPLYQAMILAGLGDNISSKVVRIMPTTFGLDLTAGSPTGNPGTITLYNYLDASPGAHTLSYDTVIINGGVNAGWSTGAAIATVNGTGVVTRVAVGHCLLRITSDDGAVTFVDVNCT